MDILVNNAGVTRDNLIMRMTEEDYDTVLDTNLKGAFHMIRHLSRSFIKQRGGKIINISSVTAAQSNPHGCAYGATKAGLASFSRSLFDESRKYGVKSITISPDMTQTNLYRNADFREGDDAASYLLPDDVADAVEWILAQRDGVIVTDITLKPQRHRIQRKVNKNCGHQL